LHDKGLKTLFWDVSILRHSTEIKILKKYVVVFEHSTLDFVAVVSSM